MLSAAKHLCYKILRLRSGRHSQVNLTYIVKHIFKKFNQINKNFWLWLFQYFQLIDTQLYFLFIILSIKKEDEGVHNKNVLSLEKKYGIFLCCIVGSCNLYSL